MKFCKSFSLALLAMMCATAGQSRTLSTDQAWNRTSFAAAGTVNTLGLNSGAVPKLVYTESVGESPAVYIFSNGNRGFYVVSANDVAVPVLGYSTEAGIDPANLPPSLEAFLQDYAAQIAAAEKCGGTVITAAPDPNLTSVAPILKTLWNQDSPYNDLCPAVDDNRTPSGCVATAAAQVLKSHEYPAKGKGTYSYTWNDQELSFDYDNTPFDWEHMTDTYGSGSTAQERSAVATLMYAIGVGSNMNYAPAGSGATTINLSNALVRNFGFDKSVSFKMRNYYSLEEWMNMLHEELAAGYPIYYEGSGTGAHAFVVDGYDAATGLVHVNWGWGGSSNGYFQITSMNPSQQGIGGSNAGYSNGQMALFGLRPAKSGSRYTPYVVLSNDLETRKTDYTRSQDVELLGGASGTGIFSYSLVALTYQFGLELTDADGNVSYAWGSAQELKPYWGFSQINIPASRFPEAGKFTARMVGRYQGEIFEIRAPLSCVNALSVICTDVNVSFTPIADPYKLSATDLKFSTSVYVNKTASATATVTNSGAEYFGEIKLGFLKTDSYTSEDDILLLFENTASVDLLRDESAEVNLKGKVSGIEAGSYYVGVFDRNRKLISDLSPVTVKAEPAETTVQMAGRSFPGALSGKGTQADPYVLYHGTVDFSVKLRCTRGYFDDIVSAWIYVPGQGSPVVGNTGSYTPFDAGKVGEVTFSADWSQLQTNFTYVMLIYNGTRSTWIDANGIYLTFIEGEPDGIADVVANEALALKVTLTAADRAEVTASGAEMTSLTAYSISGAQVLNLVASDPTPAMSINIGTLPRGHYILRAITADGHSLTTRLLKP